MYNLKIIVASTRPGRKGPAVAAWIYEALKSNPAFSTELLDLAVINLPFLDEPEHPRLQKYQHQHTKDWSAKIDSGDAFLIVTPEYNFGYPAAIKNALDFLYNEWCYKPVAFVSYGGIAAGTRCTQMLKQVVTAQKMMPVTEAVNIPFFTTHINAEGVFVPTETITKSANVMIGELTRWTEALKPMRNKQG